MASSTPPPHRLIDQKAEQFTLGTLSRSALDPSSPIPQFRRWFAHALASPAPLHPETCTLSTAALPSGRVSARVVYLKELDARGGFVVYSNVGTSRKAADLASNPHAALTFHWEALQRQVRVEGTVERNSREESQAYFDTRVRGSRIGAWASRQSAVLRPGGRDDNGDGDGDDGRAQLDEWVREVEERFKDKGREGEDQIPVPEFWGGLRLMPTVVEFWQGRDNRLHDRFVYTWEAKDGEGEGEGQGSWRLDRLSP
ncbi:Pyridoxamine 5'-phosphate oxidase [Escovopsis weberi]|uniref:pyridoxal 5'-phosphate synthase n=1 Tax=Escovopsis weberi TaxID=150374 RepID=A0A0N0RT45_ESCWE|nr:Pyridoxamine 5'-phosphate oxidase [Escovopsis weberi]